MKFLVTLTRIFGLILLIMAISFTMDVFNRTGGIGATLTTITSTDSVADFPTTYNANLSTIDNSFFELSTWFATSSAPQLTTLSNQNTTGTITSGTWTATDIGVAHGGTGSSTPTGLLYGDGAGNLNTIPYGNSGQFLTSQGAGTIPQYTTSSIDESLDRDWTGTHTFSQLTYLDGGFISSASSTINSTLNVTGNATSSGDLSVGGDLTLTNDSPTATTTVATSNMTWNRPTGVDKVEVIVVGAGGGGGGSDGSGSGDAGGGGSGAYATAIVEVSSDVTVTVGSGGTGGDSISDGSDGGDSSFAGDITVTAGGGSGGVRANNGGAGGAGGTATNADFSISGESGGDGSDSSYGGHGGGNPYGQRTFRNEIDGNNGVNGNTYGGGGQGAFNTSGSSSGGDGADGVVIIKWQEIK